MFKKFRGWLNNKHGAAVSPATMIILFSCMFVTASVLYHERSSKVPYFELNGPITGKLAVNFRNFMLENRGTPEVNLYIRSRGGSVYAGRQIIHYINQEHTLVNCEVDSNAESIAAIILTYCHTVRIADTAAITFHIYRIAHKGKVHLLTQEKSKPKDWEMYKMDILPAEVHILTPKEITEINRGADVTIYGHDYKQRLRESKGGVR